MFDFRLNVLQMIVSLLMSTLSTLLIEQKWKTGILLIVAGALGILILSIAIAIARRIADRSRRTKKKAANIKKKSQRGKRSGRPKKVRAA